MGLKYYIAGFKQQLEVLDTVGFNTLLSRSISFLYLVVLDSFWGS